MVWQGKRRATLPSNWPTLRRVVLKRDPQCRLAYDCCTTTSTEVDHIGASDDHRLEKLRGVCTPCHKRRTQTQANPSVLRKRPGRRHPALGRGVGDTPQNGHRKGPRA